MAVQAFIYEVDLAYQTGGLPRMPAPARVCDIPDKRATPVWRMEKSSRHTIPLQGKALGKPGVWDWIGKST